MTLPSSPESGREGRIHDTRDHDGGGVCRSDGRRYFGHNGGAPGMNGELRIFPPEPGHEAATIVVLANRDPPAATSVANFISDRLP